ncbi:MAG: hypothetical protein AAF986_11225 [Pseudomonadota bacterium]
MADERQCKFCGTIFSSVACPQCEKQHEEFSKSDHGGFTGKRKGRPTLDIQEGNWEEWH